jgi:hypothetical protein
LKKAVAGATREGILQTPGKGGVETGRLGRGT